MKTYVVISGEFTNNVDESRTHIFGVYENKLDAMLAMKVEKENSLREFSDEYVYFENEQQTIIKSNNDEDYSFEIEIVEMETTEHKPISIVETIRMADGTISKFSWTDDDYEMVKNYWESRQVKEIISISINGKEVSIDDADSIVLEIEEKFEK